jgi:hypothetical protein
MHVCGVESANYRSEEEEEEEGIRNLRVLKGRLLGRDRTLEISNPDNKK